MCKIFTFKEAIKKAKEGNKKVSILLGNGFSVGWCRKFAYQSLYEYAMTNNVSGSEILREEPVASAFKNEGGKLNYNFEEAIKKLDDENANKVRQLLVKTITAVHPRGFDVISKDERRHCENFLMSFDNIFTLNYDFLADWIVLGEDQLNDALTGRFRTFARDNSFFNCGDELGNLVYLHGCLAFYKNSDYQIERLLFNDYVNKGGKMRCLEDRMSHDKGFPLYVAEGSSEEKSNVIDSNCYLKSVLEKLKDLDGILFIFGADLFKQDMHIVNAIKNNKKIEHIYFGVYEPSKSKQELQSKACEICKGFGFCNKISFFDSKTAKVWREP